MAAPVETKQRKVFKPKPEMSLEQAREELAKQYTLIYCRGCDKCKWLPGAFVDDKKPLPMCKTCRTNGKMANLGADGPGYGIYVCDDCDWKWTSDDHDVNYETACECPSAVRTTKDGEERSCDASSFPKAIGPMSLKKAYEIVWKADRREARAKKRQDRPQKSAAPRQPRAQQTRRTEQAPASAATEPRKPRDVNYYVAPLVVHATHQTHVAANAMHCVNTGRSAALKLSGSSSPKPRSAAEKARPDEGVWRCNRCQAVRDFRFNETADCAACQAVDSIERVL